MKRLLFVVAVFSGLPLTARAEVEPDRFSAGGYFRIMTRPDFQGGNGRLGLWNISGRLLNEGPWGALELKLDVLRDAPGSHEAWASIHAKIEGGSFLNADPGKGTLDHFAVTQLYIQAGNILVDGVTWQLGTLDSWFGDLGLYDLKPTMILNDVVGLSGRWRKGPVELLLGVGDAGYSIRGAQYSTIFSGGGSVRLRLGERFELGLGGEVREEPEVGGNRFAPYTTPGVRYEDYVRHEVVAHYLAEHPGQEDQFPRPVSTTASSWKAIGYLGFGKLGPLRWSNLFAELHLRHPDNFYVETVAGRDYTIYVNGFTDKRYEAQVGDELQFQLVPDRLDAVFAVLYGKSVNLDNTIAPGDDNRDYYSTVLRLQAYLTRTVHFLAEGSAAQEVSALGNVFREHSDSVFRSTKGAANSRGLEFGDTDTRSTLQMKGGIVLNPTGFGIYARPSLRLLYGLQYSNAQAAFGSGFVDSLDQYNVFASPERHWHSVVAIEAEAWF